MKPDLNKGISCIEYNSLNLPQSIEIDNQGIQGRVKYTYSASGVKLKTIHETDRNGQTASIMAVAPFSTEVTDIKTTDYASNIICENTLLKTCKKEAIDAGTKHIFIQGSTVINKQLINPALAKRFGYTLDILEV